MQAEVIMSPAISMVWLVFGWLVMFAILGVIAFGVFKLLQGRREEKEYRGVVLPGLMNQTSNTDNVKEDSIESLDLNAYVNTDGNGDDEPDIDAGPSLPMPMSFQPMNDGGTAPVTTGTTDNTHDAPLAPGTADTTFHATVDSDFPVQDTGSGVDSMMSTLNGFSMMGLDDDGSGMPMPMPSTDKPSTQS